MLVAVSLASSALPCPDSQPVPPPVLAASRLSSRLSWLLLRQTKARSKAGLPPGLAAVRASRFRLPNNSPYFRSAPRRRRHHIPPQVINRAIESDRPSIGPNHTTDNHRRPRYAEFHDFCVRSGRDNNPVLIRPHLRCAALSAPGMSHRGLILCE